MWRGVFEAVLFGVLEGVTEWLPVSSTGHLILLERWLSPCFDEAFFSLFEVVIQLGAILAVVLLFFAPLWPFSGDKSRAERRDTWFLWGKIVLATLPAVIAGLLLEEWLDQTLYNAPTVAATLIFYGVLFLLLEKRQCPPRVSALSEIGVRDALLIGCFQVLSLVPGTSRSGATILGGRLLGVDRPAAAAFSFYLAIPVMAGASALKAVKFFAVGQMLSTKEWVWLLTGTLTAFLVSLVTIRFLMEFVRRRSFSAFGVYRIFLGAAVLLSLLIS
ncbi:MAG: undecaprenyl-diphosphate phosphatase [Ruminococcaceae bacterium]|nr:undecaprenyl-diphosphate phosphatase [Oscillospiraceae bacterium]